MGDIFQSFKIIKGGIIMKKFFLLGFILLLSIVCCCGTTATNLNSNNVNNDDLTIKTEKILEEDIDLTSTPNVTKIKFTPSFTITPKVSTTINYTSTFSPTKTSTTTSGISLEGLYLLYLSTTELQFKEYMSYAYGEKIQDQVVVGQVLDDGNVALAGEWSEHYYGFYEFCVIVQNVPKDIAMTYVKGHSIYLEATIYSLIGDYNYYYDCENTLILSYIDSH